MEWLVRMNAALDELEAELNGDVDIEHIARIAVCSPFHFQRLFGLIAGIPLAEYIRRRRMTLAALELTAGNAKVIDLALKYGYESPTAFNRAFQSIHGLPPSRAREAGVRLTAFPRVTFTLSVKGETAMNYRIEKKDAFRIVGMKETLSANVETSFARVPQFWQENAPRVPDLCKRMNAEPMGVLGVSTCANADTFDYFIAVASTLPVPEGLSSYTVPATTWAVFECVGALPDAIQTLQKRVVTEWLPTSGYEYANAPDVEVYFEGDQRQPDYRCEVWLPIARKA